MLRKINSKKIFVFSVLFTFIIGFSFFVPITSAQSADEIEAQLRQELEKIEKEEAEVQQTLNVQKGKTATIQRDVNILTGEIKKAELNIDKKNINIKQLGSDIALKDQTVTQLNEKIESGKSSLSQLIKKTNELDSTSMLEIVLRESDISDFFINIDIYEKIQKSLEELFDEIREIRGLTEEEKIKLQQKRAQEADVKAEIEYQKRQVEVKESEKKNILSISKSTEATYEQILADKRARASSIRAALFQLRDTQGISFGDALNFANDASAKTGVRAAFILAILKQESDLGNNVGTCNRPGDPAHKKWDTIMPGPLHYANYLANGSSCGAGAASPCSWRDDQTTFKRIAGALGLDYKNTPLSCPIASVGGWGGAMGPSQFIPTTWASYESRIAAAVGVSTPNPWNPEHAFVATGIYIKDLGAAGGGYSAEHKAAAQYYAGGNWSGGPGQSYGTSVLNHAANFQEQIDFLKDVN